MGFNIKAQEFSGQLVKAMKYYSQGVEEATKKVTKEVGDEAKKMLRQRAPSQKKKRTEEYRKSLKVKHTIEDWRSGFTLYSEDHWQLTHLLESGHDIVVGGKKNPSKNDPNAKKGKVQGSVDAIPHFEPVQEWAENEISKRLEKELKG